MKNFILTISFGFILNLIISISYHGASMQTLIKSFQMFLLLNLSALSGFLSFFHFKDSSHMITAVGWLVLILFAIYIYKYASHKYSVYLWFIFIILWLLLGMYNPGFRA